MKTHKFVISVLVIVLTSITSDGWAADKTPEANAATQADSKPAARAKTEAGTQGADQFAQFKFGIGIGISDLSKADILETQIEQSVVRITNSETTKRGLWLETHYLLDRFALGNYASHGPFFGIQVFDGNEVIKGVALGYMLSLKRTRIGDSTSKAAFNLGIGLLSTKIKVLGNGIVEDQALPAGVESVRLRSKDETGLLLMFSVSVF